MIETLLTARGHDVQAASTGTKGVHAAMLQPPDVVLLDLHLPGTLDGFVVCKRLRDAEATATVPIVVISALNNEVDKDRALRAGASSYYTKPFSPTALLKELESLQSRASARTKLSD